MAIADNDTVTTIGEGGKRVWLYPTWLRGRLLTRRAVAHAVLFLASEGAEFSTGSIIDVNGASYLRS